MLAYVATKEQFLNDAPTIQDIVREQVRKNLNLRVGENEYRSWRNSLGNAMANVMRDSEIPADAGIAIEYRPNSRNFRIDFMISGHDREGKSSIYIVELKQWEDIEPSDIPDHVKTFIGGALRDEPHPSYKAWSYHSHMKSQNEFIYTSGVRVGSCAYLHNCPSNEVITASLYETLLAKSPVFIKGDHVALQTVIKSYVSKGGGIEILEQVDRSPIRPSKQLADAVGNMLKGVQEYVLLDDQKTIYEKLLAASRKSVSGNKQVVIIDGGPGTGKSVISINALSTLTKERLNTRYVTANAAPRKVFEARLKNQVDPDTFKHLFTSSWSFYDSDTDAYDVLIADEAHRLTLKSGIWKNKGENQIREIINAARTSVFLIDEAQKVTWSDIGEKDEIRTLAQSQGAEVQEFQLTSQFRCGGSDDYLAWLEQTLGVKPPTGQLFNLNSFDFRVFENPREMHDEIRKLNEINNKSRVVAGYCWNWVSKSDPRKMDIYIGDYKARWNLANYNDSWIINPNSVDEVGCIHTCQGLEVDYVGVIIGEDLKIAGDHFVTNPFARAKTDKSLFGFKKAMKEDEISALRKADEIIRNTYRTLMSRGMKGCFIHCTDTATNEYFKRVIEDLRGSS